MDTSFDRLEKLEHTNDIVLLGPVSKQVTDMDDIPFDAPVAKDALGSAIGLSHSAASKTSSSLHVSDAQKPICEGFPMREELRTLIYWRKPLQSAAVLTTLLAAQLSFLCLSAISVIGYLGFFLLVSINLCRFYCNYINTENKLFKDYLERDFAIPKERAADFSRRLTDAINSGILHTREIFLLTNIGASIKFAVFLYLMTYVGARFNFLTLCILATTLVFFVPKFYEAYQSELDRFGRMLRDKTKEVAAKINAKVEKLPIFGSKKKTQ